MFLCGKYWPYARQLAYLLLAYFTTSNEPRGAAAVSVVIGLGYIIPRPALLLQLCVAAMATVLFKPWWITAPVIYGLTTSGLIFSLWLCSFSQTFSARWYIKSLENWPELMWACKRRAFMAYAVPYRKQPFKEMVLVYSDALRTLRCEWPGIHRNLVGLAMARTKEGKEVG
jgi:hypothetical protein